MGLDIYFNKIRKSSLKGIENPSAMECHEAARTTYANDFSKAYDSFIKKMSSVAKESYDEEYRKECKKLLKFFNYYWHLESIGVRQNNIIPQPIQTLIDAKSEILKFFYTPYASYFRKVNFLYQFFLPKMDEKAQMAMVTKEDLEALISNCKQILAAEKDNKRKKAEELLPTRAGFFFGSTEYDDWYFEDVQNVKNEMSKLLKYIDNNFIWVEFSW